MGRGRELGHRQRLISCYDFDCHGTDREEKQSVGKGISWLPARFRGWIVHACEWKQNRGLHPRHLRAPDPLYYRLPMTVPRVPCE